MKYKKIHHKTFIQRDTEIQRDRERQTERQRETDQRDTKKEIKLSLGVSTSRPIETYRDFVSIVETNF